MSTHFQTRTTFDEVFYIVPYIRGNDLMYVTVSIRFNDNVIICGITSFYSLIYIHSAI